MKNRVLFEAYKLKHPNTGLYHFTAELIAALNHKCPVDFRLELFLRPGDQKWVVPGVPYHWIRFWSKLFPPTARGVKVWHSPYQMSPFIPKNKNIKLLVTVHDLNFLYEKDEKKRGERIVKLQKNIDRASAVVAISEYSKTDLLRHIDLKGKSIEVIYNGCNIYKGPLVEPSDKPHGEFLFGVGTILRKKNWHVLPTLLVDNDLLLYLAGTSSAYGEVIMDEARKLGVDHRVNLVGEVSEARKHWYLSHCKAFVFPSIAEGFGLPVIEAMYYGKPIFLSPHTSLPEVGGKFAYYFPVDFDPSLMRDVFRDGMDHFAKNGNPTSQREYAMSFSWQKAAEKYWEIYKKLSE